MQEVVDMTDKLVLGTLLEHISDGKSVRVTATGRSMLPTFRPNVDTIILSPASADALTVGDVVFFNRGDAVCVHRIIARKGDRLIIRGDGNTARSLEPARISSVFAVVSGGTMHGGKPFTVEDRRWKENTRLVMKYFPLIARWHQLMRVLRVYPLSILVLLVLMYLSFMKTDGVSLPVFPNMDKIVHFCMYFGLSSVFWLEWIRAHAGKNAFTLKGVTYCFVLPLLVGVGTELVQGFLVEYRSGDWLDFVANACGVVLSTFLAYLYCSSRRRSK